MIPLLAQTIKELEGRIRKTEELETQLASVLTRLEALENA